VHDGPPQGLLAGPCDFVKGVVSIDGLPEADRPEVAFAGRSNVGKSSLINAVLGRKGIARTSNTPGRTQEVNYFDLSEKLYLVDLPGYGYAEAPKTKVQAWNVLIRDYLRGRVSLRRVFLLIDSRHGVKPIDLEIMSLLDVSAVSYQIVLTKMDKLRPDAVAGMEAGVAVKIKKRPAAFPHTIVTSASKGWGLEALRDEITSFVV
jgi:GTP-binding protein